LLSSSVAPCIALEREGNVFRCGLLRNPARYLVPNDAGDPALRALMVSRFSPYIAYALAIGAGCDSDG
jgi:hypothetical protein